jgi:hypothetical protein
VRQCETSLLQQFPTASLRKFAAQSECVGGQALLVQRISQSSIYTLVLGRQRQCLLKVNARNVTTTHQLIAISDPQHRLDIHWIEPYRTPESLQCQSGAAERKLSPRLGELCRCCILASW